jgi:hypothetical protein
VRKRSAGWSRRCARSWRLFYLRHPAALLTRKEHRQEVLDNLRRRGERERAAAALAQLNPVLRFSTTPREAP